MKETTQGLKENASKIEGKKCSKPFFFFMFALMRQELSLYHLLMLRYSAISSQTHTLASRNFNPFFLFSPEQRNVRLGKRGMKNFPNFFFFNSFFSTLRFLFYFHPHTQFIFLHFVQFFGNGGFILATAAKTCWLTLSEKTHWEKSHNLQSFSISQRKWNHKTSE